MKGLVCKVCGYVALDGKTDVCPVCHAKNAFEEKEDAYKMPDFVVEKGESEKKHIPSIKIMSQCGAAHDGECSVVHVNIGEIQHPSMPEHHITTITFYIENKYAGVFNLTSDIVPSAVLHLKSGTKGKVQVIENCNIHGKWYNEIVL